MHVCKFEKTSKIAPNQNHTTRHRRLGDAVAIAQIYKGEVIHVLGGSPGEPTNDIKNRKYQISSEANKNK